jgi:hypothetical protein
LVFAIALMDWQISGLYDHSFAWGLSEGGVDHLAKVLAVLRQLAGDEIALTEAELRLLQRLNDKQIQWEMRHAQGAIRWSLEPWSETPRLAGEARNVRAALAQMAEAARRHYGIEAPEDRRSASSLP